MSDVDEDANPVGFNQRNRDRWVADIARRLQPSIRLLDVGAGEARYRALFAHCDYRTQDFGAYHGTSEGLLKEQWRYTPLDYECDATAIPVEDESFDAILCTEVLEHVPEPIKVLKELGRILKPNGSLFLSAPLGSGLHQQPFHFYGGFTPHFYHRFLSELGLKVVSIQPNGRFFRMLLQELHRGIAIIRSRGEYSQWSAAYWILKVASSLQMAQWLARLDDDIQIDEFTVGYHVEAIKER
jgi:SAM-dependent methyltransferase